MCDDEDDEDHWSLCFSDAEEGRTSLATRWSVFICWNKTDLDLFLVLRVPFLQHQTKFTPFTFQIHVARLTVNDYSVHALRCSSQSHFNAD